MAEDQKTRDAHVARIYVDGVFDLFHPGHVAFLRKARGVCDGPARLVVGVITDGDAAWKRRPVMTHAERVAMVRSCREVDEVVEEPPLVLTPQFLEDLRLDYVVHGDDDRQERYFGAAIARGIMRYVPYTAGVSTTDLIRRAFAFELARLTAATGAPAAAPE